jgi:O-antigen/teichoic acid export membrane protein
MSIFKLIGFFGLPRKRLQEVLSNTIPSIIGLLSSFLVSVLVARILGADAMGQYALIISIVTIVASLSEIGLTQTMIRYSSQAAGLGRFDIQSRILNIFIFFRVGLSIFITILAFLIIPYIENIYIFESDLYKIIRVSLFEIIAIAVSSIPIIYLTSNQKHTSSALVLSIQKIIVFGSVVLLLYIDYFTLKNIIYAKVIASMIAAIIFISIIPKNILFNKENFNLLKNLEFKTLENEINLKNYSDINNYSNKFYWPYLIIVFLSLAIGQIDNYMIAHFLGIKEVGIYNVALNSTLPLSIILGAISTIIWPYVSRISGAENIKNLINKMKKIILLTFILFLIYSIFAPRFIVIIFGGEFVGGVLIGQILCLKCAFSVISGPLCMVGYNLGLTKKICMIVALQLAIVFIINFMFIDQYGINVSAIALLSGEIASLCLFSILIFTHLRRE